MFSLAKEIEASCLLKAMHWVKRLDFHNVMFKIDAKSVVDDLNRSKYNAIEIGALFDDYRRVLEVERKYSVGFAR